MEGVNFAHLRGNTKKKPKPKLISTNTNQPPPHQAPLSQPTEKSSSPGVLGCCFQNRAKDPLPFKLCIVSPHLTRASIENPTAHTSRPSLAPTSPSLNRTLHLSKAGAPFHFPSWQREPKRISPSLNWSSPSAAAAPPSLSTTINLPHRHRSPSIDLLHH